MTEAEELELLELEEKEAQAKAAAPAPTPAAEPQAAAPQAQPTLDATNTGLFHFARHLAGGLGDKIIAAEQALGDKLHDKTGKAQFGDAYRRNLAFNDKLLEDSDKAHPTARWVGNVAGFAGNAAALAAPGALRGGAAALQALPRAAALRAAAGEGLKTGAVLGGLGGYGASRSDSALGTALDTGLGAGLGGAAGAAAPYVADLLGRGAGYLGEKTRDLAAWMKVHSLHPTPKLGEAMAELPGGEVGVGRELLERGLGGLTKKGTAKQVTAATNSAGKAVTQLAAAHDAAGGAPVTLDDALNAAMQHASELHAQPTSRAAGERLAKLVAEYQQMYGGRQVPAADALALKRALGDEAYGAGEALKRAGDKLAGDYGKGVGHFERSVDAALDKQLGPGFEQANLTFRRLLGAKQAAVRTAARAQTNHILGLIPAVAGAGGFAAHGTPGAAAAALGTTLLGKYGTQAGARILYSPVGGGLNLLGRGLSSALARAPESGLAAEGVAPLLDGLVPMHLAPGLADKETDKRAKVLALRGGVNAP